MVDAVCVMYVLVVLRYSIHNNNNDNYKNNKGKVSVSEFFPFIEVGFGDNHP